MESENGKWDNLWEKGKKLLSQWIWIWVIWGVSSILLMIGIGFDLCQKPYWSDWLEEIFTYNIGNVIAIIVVIWTFTVSLSTYCIEKLGKHYYGIRMFDVLRFDLKLKGIFALAGLVLTKLFVLILSAIAEWEITIAIIAVQQFLLMIYIFIMVIIKTSANNVFEQTHMEINRILEDELTKLERETKEEVDHLKEICQEMNKVWTLKLNQTMPFDRNLEDELTKLEREMEEEVEHQKEIYQKIREAWILKLNQAMLFKMTRGLDYMDYNARDKLFQIIENVSIIMSNGLESCPNNQSQCNLLKIRQYINIVSYRIASEILHAGKTREVIMDFLYRWISIECLVLEVKQGIVMALFEDLTPRNISIYHSLVQVEMKHKRELQIWGAVYNIYIRESSEEEQWRSIYIEQQLKELYSEWKQKDSELAMEYWKQILGQTNTYRLLFQYIFLSERLEVL